MASRREEGEPMEENFKNPTWVRVFGLLLILSISIWCFFVHYILDLFIILSFFIWCLVVNSISGSLTLSPVSISGFLDPINFWVRDRFTANGQSLNASQQTLNWSQQRSFHSMLWIGNERSNTKIGVQPKKVYRKIVHSLRFQMV